jgi:predicted MFS family arabinose efflux permease
MFFLGLTVTVIGAAAKNIGLSPTQIGLMLAVQNVGFIISVSLSGALADVREKPRLLLVGSLVMVAGLLTFYLSHPFWLFLVAMMLIGAGGGVYEGVTDAMLMDLHQERESLHISINHFFVTFGCLAITAYLIFLQNNWRHAIIQAAIVVLLLALFFGLARLESRGTRGESYRQRIKVLTNERAVVVLFICAVLVVGAEIGAIGILTSYLMDLRGFTQVTSKVGLITFLSGVLTGRLLVGILVKNQQIPQYVLGLMGLAVLSFTALFVADLKDFIYAAIYVAGFSVSALLPLLLSAAGLMYRQMAGTVLGLIKIALPVGGILIPFFISAISRYASFQAALLVFPLSFLIAFILFFTIRKRLTL